MSVGSNLLMFFFGILIGEFFGYLIRFLYNEYKKNNKLDDFIRSRLSEFDYLKIKNFYVEQANPIGAIIFLQNKLKKEDFNEVLELLEVKLLK